MRFVVLLLLLSSGGSLFAQISVPPPADSLQADSILRRVDSLQRTGALRQLSLPADTPAVAVDTVQTTDTGTAAVPAGATPAAGRKITITGTVKDDNTREGVPFATVFVPRTAVGTVSDVDGAFEITVDRSTADSLFASGTGYNVWKRALQSFSGSKTELTIELTRAENALEEVVIHAGEDPALVLMRKVVAAKPVNDPDKLTAYKCELYNKLEVDIQRLSREKFEKLPGMKAFGFIYNNLDTVSESTPFLPFFLTESLADYYYRSDPSKRREVVKASLVKGVRNDGISQFLGGMYVKLNSYKNRIPVFDKNFVSPISDNGELYYKYQLKDTQVVAGHRVFLVQYTPRRAGENCFYGDFWIADSSWAVQRINLELPKNANINWVSRLSLFQEFKPLTDSIWVVTKDKFVVDFAIPYASKKLPGFIARKTAVYSDFGVGLAAADSGLENPAYHRDIVISDTASGVSDSAWASLRPEHLTKNEKAIYTMVDTLQTMPLFVRTKNWVKFLATGRKDIGAFEIGPVWNFYSTNPIEGQRFRFGGSTTEKFSQTIQLEGYGAYGTRDERFKYKGSIFWLPARDPRQSLYLSFTHDVDRGNNYYDESTNSSNIFSNILRKRGIPFRLAFVEEMRAEWYREFYSGFSYKLIGAHRNFTPYLPLPAVFTNGDGAATNTLTSTEAGVNLRMAYKERFIDGKFRRASLGSRFPIGDLQYTHGWKGDWGGGYAYDRVALTVTDKVRLGALGKGRYAVFAGQVFGTLPYPLLEILPGNDFYSYNPRAFNMMYRFEFIADRYAGFMWEHNIGGGVFNYLPYVRKAKLRQFWTAKGVMGQLSEANKELNFNKGYPFRSLSGKPYLEIGTGVENIFRLFRVDFVWRVTPATLPVLQSSNVNTAARQFGVFGSMKLEF